MALEVIGAGLGRNATLSSKLALEHLGFGPCYHMLEVFANLRRDVPLWIAASRGQPDWDAIFDGYRSTTDYPASSYWRELVEHYPDAKVLLTTRDPDSWFDSVSETIFSEQLQGSVANTPLGTMMKCTVIDPIGAEHLTDRAYMTDWYARRNQEVIDTVPSDRLLVFHPKDGWEPLCEFLNVPVPDKPFPRVNSRDEFGAARESNSGRHGGAADMEKWARGHLDELSRKAFS